MRRRPRRPITDKDLSWIVCIYYFVYTQYGDVRYFHLHSCTVRLFTVGDLQVHQPGWWGDRPGLAVYCIQIKPYAQPPNPTKRWFSVGWELLNRQPPPYAPRGGQRRYHRHRACLPLTAPRRVRARARAGNGRCPGSRAARTRDRTPRCARSARVAACVCVLT